MYDKAKSTPSVYENITETVLILWNAYGTLCFFDQIREVVKIKKFLGKSKKAFGENDF